MRAILSIKKGRDYKTIEKDFNGKSHLDNYILLMERKGTKIIGVKMAETNSDADYIQANEDAYFDNFCITNNI